MDFCNHFVFSLFLFFHIFILLNYVDTFFYLFWNGLYFYLISFYCLLFFVFTLIFNYYFSFVLSKSLLLVFGALTIFENSTPVACRLFLFGLRFDHVALVSAAGGSSFNWFKLWSSCSSCKNGLSATWIRMWLFNVELWRKFLLQTCKQNAHAKKKWILIW